MLRRVISTTVGAIVVHALPRTPALAVEHGIGAGIGAGPPPSPDATPDGARGGGDDDDDAAAGGAAQIFEPGPAEAAGVRVGDELLGMHDE